MNTLKIPDGGLVLAGSAIDDGSLPSQTFTLSLDPQVVQDMIRAVKSSESVELSLGKNPTLHYGSKSHRIAPPTDTTEYDIYLTRPFESTRRAERLHHATDLFTKCKPSNRHRSTTAGKGPSAASKQRNHSKSSSSGLDSDMEALQNGLAAHEASRERTQMIERAPGSKRASSKTKGKLLGYESNPRSLPTSPGHNGNLSPSSTPVLSAAQQVVERARESRVSLVHELAIGSQSMDHLRGKWTGKPEDFNAALEKVAALDPDSKKWNMKKVYWKELDVWKYDYDTSEEREQAIQNAIKQFDKQRLSASEPEWQKLLPREERGKGKCLSKLQASLAKGPAQPAPKIKVQKAEDSSTSKDDGESVGSEKSKSGGEPMSRSNSGSIFSKAKKPAASVVAPVKKLPAKKTSPVKGRVAATKASGARVLSQEIIENSDSSGDEAPLARSKQRPAPKETTTTKSHTPAKSHVPASRPQQPVKRPRDDSDSSSSSGTPLSKRLKPRQPPPSSKLKEQPVGRHVERHAERNHGSQSTANASSFKSKTTSPTKSSPLASSPPTNASDVEQDYEPIRKKRKAEVDAKPVINKRRVTEPVPGNVMSKASKFKLYYQKYETLHYQISSLDNPPNDKLTSLLNLRERLQSWKKEIYRECSPT